MKTIRVVFTTGERILAIPRPTALAGLLKANESIVHNWYYNQPRELESFLKENPEKENDVLKAFAYWVMNKFLGVEEDQQRYGSLKNALQKFSKYLFKALRSIAGKIGKDIKHVLTPNPKKIKKQMNYFKQAAVMTV